MTEVLFYHLQDVSLENVLPPLLEKSLERGWRVVVQSTSTTASFCCSTATTRKRLPQRVRPGPTARAGDST
jgi:hypothetical protein